MIRAEKLLDLGVKAGLLVQSPDWLSDGLKPRCFGSAAGKQLEAELLKLLSEGDELRPTGFAI